MLGCQIVVLAKQGLWQARTALRAGKTAERAILYSYLLKIDNRLKDGRSGNRDGKRNQYPTQSKYRVTLSTTQHGFSEPSTSTVMTMMACTPPGISVTS